MAWPGCQLFYNTSYICIKLNIMDIELPISRATAESSEKKKKKTLTGAGVWLRQTPWSVREVQSKVRLSDELVAQSLAKSISSSQRPFTTIV